MATVFNKIYIHFSTYSPTSFPGLFPWERGWLFSAFSYLKMTIKNYFSNGPLPFLENCNGYD